MYNNGIFGWWWLILENRELKENETIYEWRDNMEYIYINIERIKCITLNENMSLRFEISKCIFELRLNCKIRWFKCI